MDKAQKELVGTYLRKRQVAVKGVTMYKLYEYDYFKSKGVDCGPNYALLLKRPEEINNFSEPDINLINSRTLFTLLMKHSKLIDYFKHKVNILDSVMVKILLENRPELCGHLVSELHKLDITDLRDLLTGSDAYNLIRCLKSEIDRLESSDIKKILIKKPTLIPHLKDILHKLEKDDLRYLSLVHNDFAHYFENENR